MAKSKWKKKIRRVWNGVPELYREGITAAVVVLAVAFLVLYVYSFYKSECERAVDSFESGEIGLSILSEKCMIPIQYIDHE